MVTAVNRIEEQRWALLIPASELETVPVYL